MYVIAVHFVLNSNHIGDFMKAVVFQAENSLHIEPDCVVFDVCTDPTDPRRFYLFEKYADEAAFKMHLASAHFHEFDELIEPWVQEKHIEVWSQQGVEK
jgi:autoinducer 2-degrading protein